MATKAFMSDKGLRPAHVYHQGPLASTLGTGWEHSPRCVSADEAHGQEEAERILAEVERIDPAAGIFGETVLLSALNRGLRATMANGWARGYRQTIRTEEAQILVEALRNFVSEEV